MTNDSILYGLSSYTGLKFSLNPVYRYEERKNKILATVQRPTFSEYSELTFRPYTNSIPFFFNHLVLILESLYYNTYMMRYIAQALFRVFCNGFVESLQCSNFQ